MTKSFRSTLLLAALIGLLSGPSAAAIASNTPTTYSETDVNGPVASDQTPPTQSDVVDTVTAPPPTPVNGQAVGSLTTSILSPDYTDSPDYLQVYTSTGSGTAALTGVVTSSSGVVAGASVILQAPCVTSTSSPCIGSQTTVTSDSNGGFALVNIPVATSGTPYTLIVSAAGYGSYTVTGDTYDPDTTYQTTVDLQGSGLDEHSIP